MKVPPLQNSIVCAIPSQTIVRQSVLAAVSVLSILCGAASAQSVPVAPPLLLLPAVEVTQVTEPGQISFLEHSPDLLNWEVIADPVFANGEGNAHLVPLGAPSGFYRVKTEIHPEIGTARWTMSGSHWVLNSTDGVCGMTFNDKAAGTMRRGARETPFTWRWRRNGLDSGEVSITWPDGIVEVVAMHFTGTNAGVFSSQRLSNGLPAGATTGTFRDEADASLAVSVPVTLGDALISFSGSGRPVGVQVSADGTGGIRSPAGGTSYSCNYTVTGPETAEMDMTCTNGSAQSWSLTFTGPACGICSWKSELHGNLRRASTGSFTIAPR